jgi:hypothetical protein
VGIELESGEIVGPLGEAVRPMISWLWDFVLTDWRHTKIQPGTIMGRGKHFENA